MHTNIHAGLLCRADDCVNVTSPVDEFCPEHGGEPLSMPGSATQDQVISQMWPKAKLEVDPNGRDPHQSGSKLDSGKAEYDMVLFSFPNALAQVDRIGKFGAKKYIKGGFLDVPNGEVRYFNAEIRHAIKRLQGEELDPDSEELHLAHKAWNALAELELFLRARQKG